MTKEERDQRQEARQAGRDEKQDARKAERDARQEERQAGRPGGPSPQPPPPTVPPDYIAAKGGSQEQRELVCRNVSFGPVDPYTKKLESPEYAPQLVDGSVAATKNAYLPGGRYEWPEYTNSHANPRDWDWTYHADAATPDLLWQPPPYGDPMGMIWNGKNFV